MRNLLLKNKGLLAATLTQSCYIPCYSLDS